MPLVPTRSRKPCSIVSASTPEPIRGGSRQAVSNNQLSPNTCQRMRTISVCSKFVPRGPVDPGEVYMSHSRKAHRFLILAFLALAPSLMAVAPAAAQATRAANLQITVVDQTNAVLPGATVTVVGSDGTTKAVTIEP